MWFEIAYFGVLTVIFLILYLFTSLTVSFFGLLGILLLTFIAYFGVKFIDIYVLKRVRRNYDEEKNESGGRIPFNFQRDRRTTKTEPTVPTRTSFDQPTTSQPSYFDNVGQDKGGDKSTRWNPI